MGRPPNALFGGARIARWSGISDRIDGFRTIAGRSSKMNGACSVLAYAMTPAATIRIGARSRQGIDFRVVVATAACMMRGRDSNMAERGKG
jgi:hypothetical protein